eukprot:1151392-Pelagomonas_calceolata.AAC.11
MQHVRCTQSAKARCRGSKDGAAHHSSTAEAVSTHAHTDFCRTRLCEGDGINQELRITYQQRKGALTHPTGVYFLVKHTFVRGMA